MSTAHPYIRHGFGSVRPYLYGNLDLLDFVKQAFGAEVLETVEGPKGAHVEVQIGDAVVVLELGEVPETTTISSVYVYVKDIDAIYQRALQAGGISVGEPADKPYQERNAGVKDSFGNIWWIGTYIG